MEKLPEFLWKTYEDISGWIKFSDTKAAAILGSNGVIIAVVISKIIDNSEFLLNHRILLSSLMVGFLFGFSSIYCAIRCLSPSFDPGKTRSLIYFGHIAKDYNNHYIYKYEVERAFRNDSEIINQIAYQVWANSNVAQKKYINILWASRFFLLLIYSFILAGIELAYLLLI